VLNSHILYSDLKVKNHVSSAKKKKDKRKKNNDLQNTTQKIKD
jgi:hypothetical protein